MDILGGSLGGTLRRSRAAENQDIGREERAYQSLKSVGLDELGRYKDPKLTGIQEKELADYSGAMGKTTSDFYQEAGMKDSKQEIASMKEWSDTVKGIKYDMLETTKHESWIKAIQSLGMSQDAARQIALMHTQDREEKIQLYSGLMGAIGGVLRMGMGGA